MKPKVEISCIRLKGLSDLGRWRDRWIELFSEDTRASLYQTWEWNDAWWRVYGKNKTLCMVEMHVGDRLVGLAPLYISRHLGTPFRRLAFVGTGMSDYMDLICVDSYSDDALFAFQYWIKDKRIFDLADLQQIRPGSHFQKLIDELGDGGLHLQRCQTIMPRRMEPCPYIDLPRSKAELLSSFSKKMRTNVSYYDRKLAKDYPDSRVRLADEGTLAADLKSLFHLHQKRWNARFLPGVMGSSSAQSFHSTFAGTALVNGWLRLHMIDIDQRAVSALYCFEFRNRYYYYLGGFDPEFNKLSLGTVLTARAIFAAIEAGCTEFDFLRGAEPYKKRWTSDERWNSRLLAPGQSKFGSTIMLKINELEIYLEHTAKAYAEKRGRKGEN